VHHQLGRLPRLPLSLQVDQLQRLIARMRGMTQQNSAAISASESPQSLAQPQFAYPAIPVPDRGAKRRRASYVQGSAGYEVAAADRYSMNAGMSLEDTVEFRPDLEKAASFMVGIIKDLSRCGVRATMKIFTHSVGQQSSDFGYFFYPRTVFDGKAYGRCRPRCRRVRRKTEKN
jgi:hypothetical protein